MTYIYIQTLPADSCVGNSSILCTDVGASMSTSTSTEQVCL